MVLSCLVVCLACSRVHNSNLRKSEVWYRLRFFLFSDCELLNLHTRFCSKFPYHFHIFNVLSPRKVFFLSHCDLPITSIQRQYQTHWRRNSSSKVGSVQRCLTASMTYSSICPAQSPSSWPSDQNTISREDGHRLHQKVPRSATANLCLCARDTTRRRYRCTSVLRSHWLLKTPGEDSFCARDTGWRQQ